jgi:hypothetical protein
MSVTGISGLAGLIANQVSSQLPASGQNPQAAAQSVQAQAPTAPALPVDTFTPSTQNNSAAITAQDAGLFQLTQATLSFAISNALSGQAALAAAPPADPVVQQQEVQAPAPPPAVAPPQATTNASAAAAIGNQAELQSLNTVLLGFGLSNDAIQNIDQIASSIDEFNPTVYASLIQQYTAQLAQQSGSAAAANPPANQASTKAV